VNGLQAVEITRTHPDIDLVLMDLKMPEMDGLEAVNIIRSFRHDLPIIAVTAHAITVDPEQAIAAGCTDYLSKPVSVSQLTQLVNKYDTRNQIQPVD
jgi:CheY-like chemotaxis protein